MPFFMNCTKEEQTVKAGGNYFKFAPEQVKNIKSDEIAHFIATMKNDSGLALLPPAYEEDLDWRLSEEGKATIAKLKEEALGRYIAKHRDVIANNQISLKRDLERANFKHSPAVEVSDGEIASMKIVARYAKADQDQQANKLAEVEALMEQIKKAK